MSHLSTKGQRLGSLKLIIAKLTNKALRGVERSAASFPFKNLVGFQNGLNVPIALALCFWDPE